MHTKLWFENVKRPLGRPRRGWDDNIGLDFREIGWEGVDCPSIRFCVLSYISPNIRQMGWDVWTGFIWLRIGSSGGLL
jgi:hypothetical protein